MPSTSRRLSLLTALLTLAVASAAPLPSQPQAVPDAAAKPPVQAAPSTTASPAQAQDWLQQLQLGQDARHQPRPDEVTRADAIATGTPDAAVAGASNAAIAALKSAAASSDRAAIARAREQLKAQRLLQDLRFDEQESRLAQIGAAPEFVRRLTQARQRIDGGLAEWIKRADAVLADPAAASLRTYESDAATATDSAALILGTEPGLPLRRWLASAPPLVARPSIQPAYVQDPVPEAVAADLIDSLEAPLHAEISAKAAELAFEYTRIFDFVRNSVRTEWYPGSQRGALGALRARAGNDVDQASLLISLLRASNIPARYVHGVAQLSISELEAALNLQGAPAVLEALNRALRSYRPITTGGAITAVELELTWVAARVPYVNYRGAAIESQDRVWLPLAPSIKPHVARPSTHVLRSMGFNGANFVDTYLQSNPGVSPLDRLRADIAQYLVTHPQSGPYADQLAQVHPAADALELLPASLPFKVLAADYEGAVLPDWLQPELEVRFSDAAGALRLQYRGPLNAAVGQRITLSFQAASAGDQNIINGFGGGLAQVPPYLIALRPRLALAGDVRAVGEPMPAAEHGRLEISVRIGALEYNARQRLTVGGMASIALTSGAGTVVPEELTDFVPADAEPPAARVLSNFARRYAQQWQSDGLELADLIGVRVIEPLPAITLALTQMDVARSEGVPTAMSLDSIALDAAARAIDVIARDGNPDDESLWFALTALHGSYLEHQIFEQQWAVPAVSADRLLARVAIAGQTILSLQGASGVAAVAGLAQPDAVKAELLRWLEQDYRVRVPATELVIDRWRGTGWVVEGGDGSTGYFLTGQLAGGLTIISPDQWFLPNLAALLSDPYGPEPNLDPLDVFAVKLFDDSQDQIGEVDQVLPTPLRARVEDANGRPVANATVQFTITGGGGELRSGSSSGAQVTLQSNRQGIAEATLKLGQRAEFVRYVTEAGQQYPQIMGVNKVRVTAQSRYSAAGIAAGRDYIALARPGAVDRILLTASPQAYVTTYEFYWAFTGIGYHTFRFTVLDRFNNRIANVPLSITSTFLPPQPPSGFPQCPDSWAGAFMGGVFASGMCPSEQVNLTGNSCVESSINILSQPQDTVLYVVPSNVIRAGMAVKIAAGAVEKRLRINNTGISYNNGDGYCYHNASVYDFIFGHVIYDPIGGSYINSTLLGIVPSDTPDSFIPDRTQTIESARPGEWLPVPRRLFMARPDENTSGEIPGAIMNWTAGLPEPDGHTINPQMAITAGSGAEVIGPYPVGNATFEYNLRMPPQPGRVDVHGRMVTNDGILALEYDAPPAWSVNVNLSSIQPDSLPVGQLGNVSADTLVTGTIIPPVFQSGEVKFDVERSGEEVYSDTIPTALDTFSWIIHRGWTFETDQTYSVKAAINNGTPYRIETERRMLTSQSDLVVGVAVHSGKPADLSDNQGIALTLLGGGPQTLAQTINVPSRRSCNSEGELLVTLARRAQITVDYFAVDANGNVSSISSGTLINHEWFDRGLVRRVIDQDAFPFGSFEYRVSATAEDGAHEEQRGKLEHRADRRDHLALGHSIIADVDLFDGQTFVSRTDIDLRGRGAGLSVSRNWSSAQGNVVGAFGRGWSTSLESRVELGGCGVRIIGGEGSGVEFEAGITDPQGNLVFNALDGYHGTLLQTPTGFDLYAKDGTHYHYPRQTEYVNNAVSRLGLRLLYVEDPNGNRVTRQYAMHGGVWVVSRLYDNVGREINIEYAVQTTGEEGSRPLVQRVLGPDGLEIRYTYDANGNQQRAWRVGAAYDESYTYSDFGYVTDTELHSHRLGWRMLSVTNQITGDPTRVHHYLLGWSGLQRPNGSIVRMPELRVVKVDDEVGEDINFIYNGLRGIESSFTTQVTNARDVLSTHTMNAFGGVVSVVDPIGTTTTQWNLAQRQPERVVDAESVLTVFEYDVHGNKTRETVSGRGTPVQASWTYFPPTGFNPPYIKNKIASHIDFAGDGDLYQYDTRGNQVLHTRGGKTEASTYASNGDMSSHTDFVGATTTFSYHVTGLPTRMVYADSSVSSQTIDLRARVRSRTNELNETEVISYDGLDRVIEVRNADDTTRSSEYLDDTYVRIETDEMGRETRFEHDAKWRLRRETNALNHYREIDYDANGNVETERNFAGEVTTHHYDDGDRRDRTTQPLGRITERDYDRTGHLKEERAGVGVDVRTTRYAYEHPRYFQTSVSRVLGAPPSGTVLTTTMVVDGEGRVRRSTDPLGRETSIDYDAFGRERERREPLGRATYTNYDGMGRKTSELVNRPGENFTRSWTYDSRGRELTYKDRADGIRTRTYDAKGQLKTESDPEARVTTYTYDDRGRIVTETLPGGARVGAYTYDDVGNRITEQLPNSSLRTHEYDDLNRRKESRDQLGVFEKMDYDPMGRVTKRTDAGGADTIFGYDDLGRLLREDRPLERDRVLTYTIHGEIETETNGRSFVVTHAYDTLGRRKSSIDGIGTQSFTYDDVGNLLTATDRESRITTYTYDALNRRLTQLDPAPPATTQAWTYDGLDRVLTHTDRRSIVTTNTLDGEGRVKQTERAGRTQLQTYDRSGRRITSTDARNAITRYFYDSAGRVEREERPLGATLLWTYGPGDEVLTETDADGITTVYTYDERLRKKTATDAQDAVTRYEYNNRGQQTAMVRALGADRRWVYEYDVAGRLEAVVDPETGRTTYEYDRTDNRTKIIDARLNETAMRYDELNRLTLVTHPDARTDTFIYDKEGNRKVWIRGDDQRIERDFDGLNRTLVERYVPPSSDGLISVTSQYDGNGNATQVEQNFGPADIEVWTASYDDFDRRTSMVDRNGVAVTQGYDPNDNRVSRTGPEGEIQYGFNALNQLIELKPPAATSPVAFDVSPAGRLNAIANLNGTRVEVARDDIGRVTGIRHLLGASALLALTYTLDANANRTLEVWDRGGDRHEIAYDYDKADRLTAVTSDGQRVQYQLDKVGNREAETSDGQTTTHHYDNRDRLTQTQAPGGAVVEALVYDDAGRQTTRTAGGVTTTYRYNANDRLLGVSIGGSEQVSYQYDAFGQRTGREAAGQFEGYQWDGTRLAGRTNATGTSLGDYQHAYGWPISSREGSERSFIHADTHGTPQLITTATGAIAGWARTDVWGNEQAQSGAQTRIGYTGYLKDPLLDELYAQARQYRPGSGRFTSVDPWDGDNLNPITLNKYLYGNGNPGSFTDPSGHCAGPILVLCEGAAWLFGIGATAEVATDVPESNNSTLNNRELLQYSRLGAPASRSDAGFVTDGPRPATTYKNPPQPAADGWFTGGETPALPKELEAGVIPGATIAPQFPTSTTSPIPEDIGFHTTTFPSDERMDSPVMLSESANEPSPGLVSVTGETNSTKIGKGVHSDEATWRRASGMFGVVNGPITDKAGNPILVPKRVDFSTGLPQEGSPLQTANPDAVSYERELIVDDKPMGRPLAKDRQEIIRFIEAYRVREGKLPKTIAIQRYDPKTGASVATELYTPADFLPRVK